MKLKRILVVLMVIFMAMTFFACVGTKPDPGKKNPTNGTTVPTLKDLTNYSLDAKYSNVEEVKYGDTDQQKALLQERINERPDPKDPEDVCEYNDLSVPVKIFVNSVPEDIIKKMGKAGLNETKMNATVQYLAGEEAVETSELEAIVKSNKWDNNPKWSFFDDWDYLDMLEEKADDSSITGAAADKNADNVQRQKRKMMGQVFSIGMSGDEFARLVIEELQYAQEITQTMHLAYTPAIENYDDYVKKDLSYDTLVYFKAFNQFVKNKSQTVQLYGYYYDYNKRAYDSTDNAKFEKELEYSHMTRYSNAQFLEYVEIQRSNYINSYRYTYAFYQTFYKVHFQFQGLLENFDLEVYVDPETNLPMEPAVTDTSSRYSIEMQKGMEAGFSQQLIMSDHLYVYSANETAMTEYNAANTAYDLVKDSNSAPTKDGKEYLLNIEKLKIVDYILTEMSNMHLSAVLKYHIMSYSGDMIRNIQSEKKSVVLEKVDKADLPQPPVDNGARAAADVTIGRTNAIILQLKKSYESAGPLAQFNSANSTDWDKIRPEVSATLTHDYSQYDNGTDQLEAFENLLMKKKLVNLDGTDYIEGTQGHDSALTREVYDEKHNISKFLNTHEIVLRYSIGQIEITLAAEPGANTATGVTAIYNLSKHADGVYTNGNNLEDRNMPEGGYALKDRIVPISYPSTISTVSFKANMTMIEGLSKENADEETFLRGNAAKLVMGDDIYGSNEAVRKLYQYEFEGWYIDIDLKYRVDENEKITYDMILYPGFKVTKSPAPAKT